MRRFLTLVCLMFVAIPAGITISGCTRDPGAAYCNGAGYGEKIGQLVSITLPYATTGLSISFGQTHQAPTPSAADCKGNSINGSAWTYGTSNNQLVDISPTGNMCAGTWNRNSGGGVPNFTVCSPPNPMPSTGGLPYATAYITASAESVVSNPVPVFVHPQVTTVGLVTTPLTGIANQCFSKGQVATLDAQVCAADSNNNQYLLCAPPTVTSGICKMPSITPDIIASGTLTAPPASGNFIISAAYQSGGSITGTAGETCNLTSFNNSSGGATATVALTGTNTIAAATSLVMTATGTASSAPTTATLSNGTANCSGTANITSVLGPIFGTAGQTCTLSYFNNGSTGAAATVALTGANAIQSGTALNITAGGLNATSAPTAAVLSNGTASCSGTATVATTMTPVPSCTQALGMLTYTVGIGSIASLQTNTTTNQVTITAGLPGTTPISASVAGSGSSAGYFATCPPKSISLALANGEESGSITKGVTQNLVTTVIDTNNNPITGLSLNYQSTNPVDISVTSSGAVTTSFPGEASVYAVCQPSSCNPAPINQIGLYGTGLPISSNPVTITTPGVASDYVWFGAPGQSQYIASVELLTGTVGALTRLPYVPNSMVADQLGDTIYLGSTEELMVYSSGSNSVTKQNNSVPGVVLAVAPDNSLVLINDQVRQLFYLYTPSSGSYTSYGGLGTAAAWTPDVQTLYITGTNTTTGDPTLFVYNQNTGWTTSDLSASTGVSQSLALTIPSVGAYLSGSNTVAHTWCPTGTVGNYATMSFYPQSDVVQDSGSPVPSNILTATTDGDHILSAALNGSSITLNDIGVTIPTTECTLAHPLSTSPVLLTPTPLSVNANASLINRVVPSPINSLDFITYNPLATGATTGASLPYYVPGTYTPGNSYTANPVQYVTLTGSSSITAPVAGAFSPDGTLFFVSTAGDNKIHYISIPANFPTSLPTDSLQISPSLPACIPLSEGGLDPGCAYSGTNPSTAIVPATFINVLPRSTT